MSGGKFVVTWPRVRVLVKGKRTVVAKDDMLPAGVDDAEIANLVSFGAIAGVRDLGEPTATDGETKAESGATKPPTVEEILEGVGEDKEKAAAALAAEQESRGPKARKTLVEPLEAIIRGDGS